MEKRHKKTGRKILRKILTRLLFALLIILLALFIYGYLQDLLHKIDILVKYNQQQFQKIELLEQQVGDLEYETQRLENVTMYQHDKINQMETNGNTITVDFREKEEVHREEPKEIKEFNTSDLVNPVNPITITITAIGVVGRAFASLVPTLP